MTRLIVDESLPGKLPSLVHPADLCDPSGRVLGRFFPKLDPSEYNLEPQISREELERRRQAKEKTYTTQELSEYERWEPTFSEEELQRSEKSDKWYTTEQVLAHLKNLENQ